MIWKTGNDVFEAQDCRAKADDRRATVEDRRAKAEDRRAKAEDRRAKAEDCINEDASGNADSTTRFWCCCVKMQSIHTY